MSSCIQISSFSYIKKTELSEIRYMKPWLPIHTRELQWDINIYFSSSEMEEMALTLSHSQFILSTVWWVSEFNRFNKEKKQKSIRQRDQTSSASQLQPDKSVAYSLSFVSLS